MTLRPVAVLLFAAFASLTSLLAAPVPKRSAKDAVDRFFYAVEKGKGGNTSVFWGLPEKDVLRELITHFASEDRRRRRLAISVTEGLGHRAKTPDARRLAANALLKHATNSGTEEDEVANVLHRLAKFHKDDFPPKASDAVAKFARAIDPPDSALILAGLLGVTAVTDNLKALAVPVPGRSPFLNPQWSANLALARLGDTDSTKHCLATIAGEKDLAQRARHFDEVTYMRSDDARKLLIRYLMTDDILPPIRSGEEGKKLALHALTQLAGTVRDFPVERVLTHTYTAEQLATARKWVKEQKELKWKE